MRDERFASTAKKTPERKDAPLVPRKTTLVCEDRTKTLKHTDTGITGTKVRA